MNLPGLIFGFLVATGAGLLFHLIRGGNLYRLTLYLTTAWIGFALGQALGDWFDWNYLRVGPLNLFSAGFATLLALLLASLLAGPNQPSSDDPSTDFLP